jgi:hypothetical protein
VIVLKTASTRHRAQCLPLGMPRAMAFPIAP